MRRSPDTPRAELWRRFLETFTAAIGPGAFVLRPKHTVAWRDGEALNHLELVRWSEPDAASPRAPRLTRLNMNVYGFEPAKSLLGKLAFAAAARPSAAPELRLEWTTLDRELLEFAGWLPLWVRGRLDSSMAIPLPPHPSHIFGAGLRTTAYAWTAAAWRANARASGKSASLPRYAIRASRVLPAGPDDSLARAEHQEKVNGATMDSEERQRDGGVRGLGGAEASGP